MIYHIDFSTETVKVRLYHNKLFPEVIGKNIKNMVKGRGYFEKCRNIPVCNGKVDKKKPQIGGGRSGFFVG